jgi:ADP-heptose:LPS heptosyltransferase
MQNNLRLNLDCRYYIGEKPCKFGRLCEGCEDYLPFGTKILIIKLAAIGDVLRTTTILHGLKKKHHESHITWLTDVGSIKVLKNNPHIDRLLLFDLESVLRLEIEEFDVLICLDKELRGSCLAEKVSAKEKHGFIFDKIGNIRPINKNAEYNFLLGLSDDIKFYKNKKTYPELIYETCDLQYDKTYEYIFNIPIDIKKWAMKKLINLGVDLTKPIIGLNTGAGGIFAEKAWTIDGYGKLCEMIEKKGIGQILLLGGPNEIERNKKIRELTKAHVFDTGCDNTITEFAGIVSYCSLMVTGDTLAMHIAIALKVPILLIIGSTSHAEIELYGRGDKIVSVKDCAPCYKRICQKNPTCMEEISPDLVFDKLCSIISKMK